MGGKETWAVTPNKIYRYSQMLHGLRLQEWNTFIFFHLCITCRWILYCVQIWTFSEIYFWKPGLSGLMYVFFSLCNMSIPSLLFFTLHLIHGDIMTHVDLSLWFYVQNILLKFFLLNRYLCRIIKPFHHIHRIKFS